MDVELEQSKESVFSQMIQRCYSLCERMSCTNVVHYMLWLCLISLTHTFVLSTLQKQNKKMSLAQNPACTVEVRGNCSSNLVPSE